MGAAIVLAHIVLGLSVLGLSIVPVIGAAVGAILLAKAALYLFIVRQRQSHRHDRRATTLSKHMRRGDAHG